jgi:hypothetical protein
MYKMITKNLKLKRINYTILYYCQTLEPTKAASDHDHDRSFSYRLIFVYNVF